MERKEFARETRIPNKRYATFFIFLEKMKGEGNKTKRNKKRKVRKRKKEKKGKEKK